MLVALAALPTALLAAPAASAAPDCPGGRIPPQTLASTGDTLEYGIFDKSGTWLSYGDQRLGQGRENVRNYLRENPTLSAEIEAKVREKAAAGAQPFKGVVPLRAAAGAAEEF